MTLLQIAYRCPLYHELDDEHARQKLSRLIHHLDRTPAEADDSEDIQHLRLALPTLRDYLNAPTPIPTARDTLLDLARRCPKIRKKHHAD